MNDDWELLLGFVPPGWERWRRNPAPSGGCMAVRGRRWSGSGADPKPEVRIWFWRDMMDAVTINP